MPYIPQERREALDDYTNALADYVAKSATEGSWIADLNYCCTRLILGTLQRLFGQIRYWQIVTVLGTLSAMSIEFYRRVASPYETHQLATHGDLFEFAGYDMALAHPDPGSVTIKPSTEDAEPPTADTTMRGPVNPGVIAP